MIDISIDNASVQSIISDIRRLDAAGKKSIRQGAEWAGVYVCKSLGANSRISKKSRPIVKREINGVSVRGVMMYRNGKEVFMPIDTTKDVPIVRFKGKGGTDMVKVVRSGKIMTAKQFESLSTAKLLSSSILTKIRMSGLAKKSWSWLQRITRRGGYASDRFGGRTLNVGSITWFGPNMKIHNRLSYAADSLKGGLNAVNVAIEDAYKSFHFNVNRVLGEHGVNAK